MDGPVLSQTYFVTDELIDYAQDLFREQPSEDIIVLLKLFPRCDAATIHFGIPNLSRRKAILVR